MINARGRLIKGPYVVREGLVLYLDAANTKSYPGTGTTWTDLSGRGNPGTLTNNPTYNSANGGSIVLDGVDDYVNGGTVNLQQNWSLEMFTSMTTVASPYGIFGQGTYSANQGLHILYDPNGRGIVFGMYANDNDYQGNFVPVANRWYHWVFTYNHSTYAKQFYANGVLQTPVSSVQNQYAGSGQFNIGASYGTAIYPANGKIASVKMYNRVLTATEVVQNYNALKGRYSV
jgi:hypothetical protein